MGVLSMSVINLSRTSIGKKVIMAVTGLVGIGFVVVHMYGNLKVFVGSEYFNIYSEALRGFGGPIFGHGHLLWLGRLVLLAAVVLHVWAAWSLYRDNRQARAVDYVQHHSVQASPAALYIRIGGVIILIFIVLHLMHFTWGVPGIHPDFSQTDVYHNLVVGFRSYGYVIALFYVVAMIALGFHLYHGTLSLVQTLGVNRQSHMRPLRVLSWSLAIVVAAGFALVPIAVMIGIIR
jgi:succinate dehydrogenase / fumarate reductase cytochrome b subunit